MDQVSGSFTMSGTQLERGPGRQPLLAVTRWDGRGALVNAFLVDPEDAAETPEWAVPAADPGAINGGA